MTIVGDAPDKEDCDAREGFTGQAGRCLQKACAAAGIEWQSIGRSNVAKRRPFVDSNDFRKAFYETVEEPIYTSTGKLSKRTRKVVQATAELEAWKVALKLELQQRRSNLVVAAGSEALKAITGKEGITNYRGSVLCAEWDASVKVLACEHPRYIVRGAVEEFWFLAQDLRKAKREAEFAEIRREPYINVIQPALNEVQYHLSIIASDPSILWTIDVETRAGTLACWAVGYRQPRTNAIIGVCVPVQTPQGPYWRSEDECEIWQQLAATCDANPCLCNQNIEYDIYYLLRYGIEPSGVWMDTMLAHSLLYPEFPKGLDFLCSWYLDDIIWYKGEGRSWRDGDREEQLWAYNVKDAVYTLRVVEEIDKQLKERELYDFYHGSV